MKNPEAVIEEAKKKMTAIITSIADSGHKNKIMQFRDTNENFVFVCAGLHPTRIDYDIDSYIEWIKENKDKLVAIGETGLDYHHLTRSVDIEKSQQVFRRFIQLAKELKKPIVLHIRNAYEDVLRILKEEEAENVVVHCFSGNRTDLDTCLERGYYISYATLLCNSKSVKKRAKQTPLDKILLETDSPWLSPDSEGLTNKPWKIEQTAEDIAELKGITKDEILKQTEENAKKIFGLKMI
jgi:TatD DNase family protein